jgi:transposase
MTNRRTYTREFKREAVRLAETSGKSISEIERDLGITTGLLYKWRQRSVTRGEQAFPGKGHQTESEEALRRLKGELEVVRQERDILKKVVAIFSQERP